MTKRKARLGACLIALAISVSAAGSVMAKQAVDWDKKLAKSRQLIDTNNVEEALTILKTFEKKYPDSGPVRYEMGRGYKTRGKMSQAKSQYKRATEVEPGFAPPWYELAAMEENDKEFQLAVNDYEKYLQLDPDSDRKGAVMERIAFCKNKL